MTDNDFSSVMTRLQIQGEISVGNLYIILIGDSSTYIHVKTVSRYETTGTFEKFKIDRTQEAMSDEFGLQEGIL